MIKYFFLHFALLATTLSLVNFVSNAQWVNTNCPYIGDVRSLAASGTNLFVGTYDGGIFLSTNRGTSWTKASTGLTDTWVWSLAVSDTNLFAGTYGSGVFLSTNNGTSWTSASTGMMDKNVRSLAISTEGGGGINLFAGTDDGVFLSTNSGTNWTKASTGLTDTWVYSIAASPNGTGGTNLFAGTRGGVFFSTNNGTSWTSASTGLTNMNVRSIAVSGTNIIAGTEGGAFLSTNNGIIWTQANTGLADNWVYSLAVSPHGGGGTNLFAGTYVDGIFLSTNNGTSWTAANSGLPNTKVMAFAISGVDLFAGTDSGVWRRPLSEMITSVTHSSGMLSHFILEQNYPNPFNPSTRIRYEIPSNMNVKLSILNVFGEEIARLVDEDKHAGVYEATWTPEQISSGIYFYRLVAGEYSQTRTLVLLR